MKVYVLEVGAAYEMSLYGVYDSEEKALAVWNAVKEKMYAPQYDITECELNDVSEVKHGD